MTTTKLISLRLPQLLVKEGERVVKRDGYSSLQEYVKDVLRRDLKARKLQESLARLDALAGSAKITPKDKRAVEEYLLKLHQ